MIYDAEHFFDGWRDDPRLRARLPARRGRGGRRERHAVRHQRRLAAARRSPRPCARSAPRCRTRALGIHCHNDAECGVANSLAAVAEGAVLVQGTMNGYGERCGNANLTSIVPSLQLKLGHDCLPTLEGWTEAAHYLDELLNLTPDPNQPYVGKNAFAHKGGMHVAGVNADPATFEHIDPAAVGNSREVLVSELSGKGTVIAHAGGALDDATAVARGRAREGARAPRLPVRGRRRLVRPADPARDRRLRAAVPARVLARDLREARGRPRADRGDDQDLGRRRSATCAWPRATARSTRSTRRCAPRSASATRTCATSSSSTTRSASSTSGRPPARPRACCSTPPTARDTWGAIGVHENVIEASWDALVDSLEAGMVRTRAPQA